VRPKATGQQPSSLETALRGNCPCCAHPTLFSGRVRFADRCRNCGLDFAGFNVGDGPAAFLTFFVGTVTVVAALLVDDVYSPPWWVHLVWIPVATGLTVGGLRLSKTWLLIQEYKHRAREGRIAE
jgi:uncharacterized protein (DUF983 family)